MNNKARAICHFASENDRAFMFVCLFVELERQSSGHSCDAAVVWQADGTEINEMT